MKAFLDKDFLLESEPAQQLYHEHASKMPIYDYHCHLPPHEIAGDKQYDNMGEIWLGGDHYKWRAMRTNGVDEDYVTGDKPWRDKFRKWAETMPYLMRNPLYHWSHLELQRYFGIDALLSPANADEIYDACTEKLRTREFSARNLMLRMNVRLVCTTDDPVDSLEFHKQIAEDGFGIKVYPAFRPDKAMNLTSCSEWKAYLEKLEAASGVEITDWDTLLEAVDNRAEFFHSMGCRLSDHGLTHIPDAEATEEELDKIIQNALSGDEIDGIRQDKFQSAFLYELGKIYHSRGWVQQFHLGVFRNNNRRLFDKLGPDTGFDSIGDFRQGPGLIRLFDQLDLTNQLSKTVLYNINPSVNEVFATLIGNFQDGSAPGKMQFGSGWWFLDTKDGMERQMNALSLMGLLSRFVGMLTDSRSFLSYPRHEYFRRVLCNLIGKDVENGELPADMDLLGQMVENICYNNAVDYFGMDV